MDPLDADRFASARMDEEMAKAGRIGPDDIRAMRGSLSRADFARQIGVTPLTVYRWELPDDATESRRPRGAVAERLRRALVPPDAPPPPPQPLPASPPPVA